MFPLDLPPSSADVVKEFADDASWVVQEKVRVQCWKGCVLMRTAVLQMRGDAGCKVLCLGTYRSLVK